MAKAYKCDRCGVFFERNLITHENMERYILQRISKDHIDRNIVCKYDLCSCCQDAFESFMLRITYSPLEVGQIIYEHGNSDPNIGHGDVIRYTPKEIEDILMEKHRDDD